MKTAAMVCVTLLFLLAALRCDSRRVAAAPVPVDNPLRVTAASALTDRYARSRLSDWCVEAHATGTDCGVLLVETPVVMEDSLVSALHRGDGAYGIHTGGVQQFARERSFRGVAYKDGTGHTWTYGAVSVEEAATLAPCH